MIATNVHFAQVHEKVANRKGSLAQLNLGDYGVSQDPVFSLSPIHFDSLT
jgi:hypothetical protein